MCVGLFACTVVEMLSAGLMDNDTATALMDFRETHGGTLSGMTRYTDHLDDMPAIGCK